jgi:ABC-2 type transport system ATP-binding protein
VVDYGDPFGELVGLMEVLGRQQDRRTALDELARSGIAVSDFALGQPSLDEVFLALTGSRADPEAATT